MKCTGIEGNENDQVQLLPLVVDCARIRRAESQATTSCRCSTNRDHRLRLVNEHLTRDVTCLGGHPRASRVATIVYYLNSFTLLLTSSYLLAV